MITRNIAPSNWPKWGMWPSPWTCTARVWSPRRWTRRGSSRPRCGTTARRCGRASTRRWPRSRRARRSIRRRSARSVTAPAARWRWNWRAAGRAGQRVVGSVALLDRAPELRGRQAARVDAGKQRQWDCTLGVDRRGAGLLRAGALGVDEVDFDLFADGQRLVVGRGIGAGRGRGDVGDARMELGDEHADRVAGAEDKADDQQRPAGAVEHVSAARGVRRVGQWGT